MTVLEILTQYSYNRDNPANRERFAKHLTIADRTLRLRIEELREMGYPICSDTHAVKGKGGYWFAADLADYELFSPEYTSRAYKIIGRDKKMRSYFTSQSQISIFGGSHVQVR